MFDVDLYKKMCQFQTLTTRNCLNNYKHLIRWTGNANILDLGCGEGSSTVELLNPLIINNSRSANLIGIDFKEDMIAAAKNVYGHLEIGFHQMDITNTQDRFKNYFDNVFSFFCLHLVNDLIWIKNLYELMKEGGQSFLLIPTKNPVFTSVMELSKEGDYIDHVKKVEKVFNTPFAHLEYPEKWIKPLMINQNFKNVECYNFIQDYSFENFDYLKKFIRSFGFLIDVIPKDQQSNFIEEVANRIVNKAKLDDHTQEIHANCGLLVLIADK